MHALPLMHLKRKSILDILMYTFGVVTPWEMINKALFLYTPIVLCIKGTGQAQGYLYI